MPNLHLGNFRGLKLKGLLKGIRITWYLCWQPHQV